MTLIVDCGATSARWMLYDPAGGKAPVETLTTDGFSVASLDAEEITLRLSAAQAVISKARKIIFYGAGCLPGAGQRRVETAFGAINPDAEVSAYSDIYASIHALAPRGKAIVSIMGTGVNAVVVENGAIIDSVRSTGYILGDYGSGAALGRELMERYVSGRLPRHLADSLEADYGITPGSVIEEVYRGDAPRAFLGSFGPWLSMNKADGYVAGLLSTSFCNYARVSLLPLWERHHAAIMLSGSVAYYFRNEVISAITEVIPSARVASIIRSPLEHFNADKLL